MKTFLSIVILLFASCKPTLNATFNFAVNEVFYAKSVHCPENGECSIELIPNKTIEFKTDNIGILYPVIFEGEKTILKYTFKRNPIPNTQDSNYTEIIYAELGSTITKIELSNENLQNLKLHFGRLCYCKGQTGYYAIKNGEFKISKGKNKSIKIDFDFIIKEVPQIISKINETISLKSNSDY